MMRTFSKNFLRVRLFVLLAVFGSVALDPIALAEAFDKPLRTVVVGLGRSSNLLPNNPSRVELACYYYPAFMVKELNDPGLKGARITIVPIIDGSSPKCTRSHDAEERAIGNRMWSGYFKGVKGKLLFLNAADGEGGGMPFAVFDWKTGKRIFQDSVLYWYSGPVKKDVEFAQSFDGKVSMRYVRVVSGDCSIPKDGTSCWNKFKEKYGLASAAIPKCIGYQEGEKKWAVGDEGGPPAELGAPSTIAYPVVVELFPRPSIKPIEGNVTCSPVD